MEFRDYYQTLGVERVGRHDDFFALRGEGFFFGALRLEVPLDRVLRVAIVAMIHASRGPGTWLRSRAVLARAQRHPNAASAWISGGCVQMG